MRRATWEERRGRGFGSGAMNSLIEPAWRGARRHGAAVAELGPVSRKPAALTYDGGDPLLALPNDGRISLGVEFGDAETFFSSRKPDLGNVTACRSEYRSRSSQAYVRRIEAKLPSAHCLVEDSFSLHHDNAVRNVEFHVVRDSWLMDLVSRYATRAAVDGEAEIAGRRYSHLGLNRYIQFQASNASIPCGAAGSLLAETDVCCCVPERFNQLLYVRDEPSSVDGPKASEGDAVPWVLHHRILVGDPQQLSLRGCHRWLNRPLSSPVQSLLPRFALRKLYLIRERRWPRCPVQSVGTARVAAGTILRLREVLRWT